jgi:hypothetical protein
VVDVAGASTLTRAEEAPPAHGSRRELFETALAERDDPHARDGLGRTMWWLGSRISRSSTASGRSLPTARPVTTPRPRRSPSGWRESTLSLYSNHAVTNGWQARAGRLVGEEGRAPPVGSTSPSGPAGEGIANLSRLAEERAAA